MKRCQDSAPIPPLLLPSCRPHMPLLQPEVPRPREHIFTLGTHLPSFGHQKERVLQRGECRRRCLTRTFQILEQLLLQDERGPAWCPWPPFPTHCSQRGLVIEAAEWTVCWGEAFPKGQG